MGDPWQAERLMLEAAALVRDSASSFARWVSYNNLCGVTLGAFYLLRGRHRDIARRSIAVAASFGLASALISNDENLWKIFQVRARAGIVASSQSVWWWYTSRP